MDGWMFLGRLPMMPGDGFFSATLSAISGKKEIKEAQLHSMVKKELSN